MTKSIYTVVPDIQHLLEQKNGWFSEELSKEFAHEVAIRLHGQLGQQDRKPTLRLSQMGDRCPCALWHSINKPELADPLPPWATFKYSFGHIIEALAVSLMKASGHEVTGEQDELVVDGIVGHRDCVVDGCIVDVKSTSSFGFKKFKDKTLAQDDSFGYLDQLDGYLVGSLEDPLVRVKDRGYILAIDKQLGHMCLYEHHSRPDRIIRRIDAYKRLVERSEPPACNCEVVPDGKSGNLRLSTKAGYSLYKHCCFPHLRTFLYATGPVYLTKVVRKPDVTEVDRFGKVVYN